MTRKLESHKVNPANDRLEIVVADEPGQGGASHRYEITGFDVGTNPAVVEMDGLLEPRLSGTILFQNGPIAEVGVNGLTHEALLAILIDRLAAFQAGPYACFENNQALIHLTEAQGYLHDRTKARMQRGVEGTHKV